MSSDVASMTHEQLIKAYNDLQEQWTDFEATSKEVEVGASIRLRQGWEEKTVIIEGLSEQRKGAPEAQKLYRETEESIAKRAQNAQSRKDMNASVLAPDKRPTKKQRRDIIRAKEQFD